MKVKVKGKVYLVRSDYICITLAGEEEVVTIYRSKNDTVEYKVGDRFNQMVNLKEHLLSGKRFPVKTLRFYL